MKKSRKLLALVVAMALAMSLLSITATAANNAPEDAPQVYSPEFFSMMPLERKNVAIDMTVKLPSERKAVPAKELIDAINTASLSPLIAEDADIAWSYRYRDNYKRLDRNGTIDLYTDYQYSNTISLELIVGKFDQLNLTNARIMVDIKVTPTDEIFTDDSTAVDGVTGNSIPVFYTNCSITDRSYDYVYLVVGPGARDCKSALLTLTLNDAFGDATVKFYKGSYESVEAAVADGAEDVTNKLLSTDPTAGFAVTTSAYLEDLVTAVFFRGDTVVWVAPFYINLTFAIGDVFMRGFYKDSAGRKTAYRNTSYKWANGTDIYTLQLDSDSPLNATYYLRLSYSNANPDVLSSKEGVVKAVVGQYDTLEAASTATDIKDLLFASYNEDGGYPADYSAGIDFTIFDINGDVFHLSFITKEWTKSEDSAVIENPLSSDTYFNITGARSADGSYLNYYVMPYEHDGYYYYGFQTIFVLDDNQPYTGATIIPQFSTRETVHVYAGLDQDGTSPDIQESGTTAVSFQSGAPVHYSAAAESGTHLKNYWVTFLTQQSGGGKLFVNGINDTTSYVDGMPLRVVKLIPSYGDHHDVFIANIGDAPLTNLTVTLENAQNVRLDDYWTIGETKTLGAFDSTRQRYSDELANIAKIRLLRDVDANGNEVTGPISGTLVISADGNETIRIKLTGVAGEPKITTTNVKEGVKWVPYSTVIQTNSIGDDDAVRFTLVKGNLPSGIELRPNGEIYGVPQEMGEFPITVRAAYKDFPEINDTAEYTLIIKENTNENVWNETDENYTISTAIPNQDGSLTIDTMNVAGNDWASGNLLFVSEGTYSYFIGLWLDGKRLVDGVDYSKAEGSTRITIASQTLGGGEEGTHTIAMEFREGDSETGVLKRAAQNYTSSKKTQGGTGNTGNQGDPGSGNTGSGSIATYTVQKGDTLMKIAKKIYGDSKYWSQLYYANQDKIEATNRIYVGQIFVLPEIPGAPSPSGSTSSTGPSAPSGKTYTVQRGDTLSSIAKKLYGSASQWKKLYEANKDIIKNPNCIYVGQVLVIPE